MAGRILTARPAVAPYHEKYKCFRQWVWARVSLATAVRRVVVDFQIDDCDPR